MNNTPQAQKNQDRLIDVFHVFGIEMSDVVSEADLLPRFRYLDFLGRCRLRSCTPGPPPFSSMNSTPACFQGLANGRIVSGRHRRLILC